MIPAKGTTLDGASGAGTIELGEKLGSGAFGEVYRAVDLVSGRKLAVKFAQESFVASGPEALAFKNDLLAAGKVKHPNVVEVLWVSEASSPPYLVMEYVEGGTLQAELRRRAASRDHVPPQQVKLWFENVIDGMQAINAVVLHRDIKPDNILIDGGTLKITDFGLAKLVDAATRSKSFKDVGAIRYLAPEAWRSEKSTIQRDMYAVGLTLFEMQLSNTRFPFPQPPLAIQTSGRMYTCSIGRSALAIAGAICPLDWSMSCLNFSRSAPKIATQHGAMYARRSTPLGT